MDPNIGRKAPPDFKTEIPVNKFGEPRYMFLHYTNKAEELNLDNLQVGFDSLQIRVWLGHSLSAISHVVVLKRVLNKWSGELVAYNDEYTDFENRKIRANTMVKKVTPKSGWNHFINMLYRFQIISLVDESDLKDYNGNGTDGISYDVEISTNQNYRFYSYGNPEENLNKFWQADAILKIAAYLEKEFDFSYTR